jgi:transposase
MISIPSAVKVFVYSLPTDMRKSFDGLHAIVTNEFGMDVMNGAYFVFLNRSLDRVKVLAWDRDGLVVWAKRLEAGRFQRPTDSAQGLSMEIDGTTLGMILGGVDLNTAKRRRRYQRTG